MYHQPSFFSRAQQQEVWIKRWVRSFQLEFLGSPDMENIRKYRADTCPNHKYIYIYIIKQFLVHISLSHFVLNLAY